MKINMLFNIYKAHFQKSESTKFTVQSLTIAQQAQEHGETYSNTSPLLSSLCFLTL